MIGPKMSQRRYGRAGVPRYMMRTGERKRERESYEKVSKVVDHDQEVHMISRFYFPAGFLAQLFWQRFGVLCLACLDIPPCCASSVHGHTRLRFFKTFCVFECKQV